MDNFVETISGINFFMVLSIINPNSVGSNQSCLE